MSTTNSITEFKLWLASWRNSLNSMNITSIPDDVDWREFFITNHLRELDNLINDPPVIDSLAEVMKEYSDFHGPIAAQQAIKNFLYDSCFICSRRIYASNLKEISTSVERSAIVKKLLALSKATEKLAKQIEAISPSLGAAVSIKYLQDRYHAGTPSMFAGNRKGWSKQNFKNSLSIQDLLICLSTDSLEEATQIKKGISKNRQIGGKRVDLHLAMDTLTDASMLLSVIKPQKPNFALVANIIESLLSINKGLDKTTVQKRYESR